MSTATSTASSAPQNDQIDRRSFIKKASAVAAVTTLASMNIPHVFAAENNTIQLAIVGCGGRGGGAVQQAMSTTQGPTKLVAMADVFQERLDSLQANLAGGKHKDQVDVKDRMFLGFDGYQKAMDCLKPGDVVILTTPPAFRWVHFKYAIDKGLNVFMEKPVTVDGPTTKKMFELADLSVEKNLKCGVGLMCRHSDARHQLFDQIKDGKMGDLILLRAYRVQGPEANCFVPKNPGKISDLLYQIQNFHAFIWASGGLFSDFNIHNIDECCWMKDAWPVKAEALGGRHYRYENIDQNFDTYDVEYTFADGAKLWFQGRCIDGCENKFASLAQGSKGSAIISMNGHTPAPSKIYRNQDMTSTPIWAYKDHKGKEPNPYQVEWDDLMTAIRKDQKYNEVRRGAEASLITSMGRMAAHTGQEMTRDDMLDCKVEFAPNVDKLTFASAPPVQPDKDGKYPVPEPGIKRDREY